jgi:hypothetical protein
MSKDLTNSALHRQNILNNPYALQEIEKATHITGIPFEGKTVVLKEQVADFFEVTLRTVENYLSQYEAELVRNGYEVIKGNRLKSFKSALKEMDVPEIYFGNIAKSPQLGILDFRAFLNLAMLMVESERARLLRQAILDIVIDTINHRTGGGTKYINQRDEDFLHSWFAEEDYRLKDNRKKLFGAFLLWVWSSPFTYSTSLMHRALKNSYGNIVLGFYIVNFN